MSTNLVNLPAKIHCRFLKQQQIQNVKKNSSYEKVNLLGKESRMELL